MITIKKKISLEFLGDAYKEAYLVFKSIPIGDLEGLIIKVQKQQEDKPEKAPGLILDIIKEYFIEGKFPDDDGKLADVSKEDLNGLDVNTTTKCFAYLTGQDIDPKVETPSESPSSTDSQPQ